MKTPALALLLALLLIPAACHTRRHAQSATATAVDIVATAEATTHRFTLDDLRRADTLTAAADSVTLTLTADSIVGATLYNPRLTTHVHRPRRAAASLVECSAQRAEATAVREITRVHEQAQTQAQTTTETKRPGWLALLFILLPSAFALYYINRNNL